MITEKSHEGKFVLRFQRKFWEQLVLRVFGQLLQCYSVVLVYTKLTIVPEAHKSFE